MFLRYEDLDLVFDNKLNAVYSLFLAFWASIFKTSWHNKQTIISFLWQTEGDMIK